MTIPLIVKHVALMYPFGGRARIHYRAAILRNSDPYISVLDCVAGKVPPLSSIMIDALAQGDEQMRYERAIPYPTGPNQQLS